MGLHIRQPQFTASNGSLPHFDFLPADVLKFRGHLVDEIGDIVSRSILKLHIPLRQSPLPRHVAIVKYMGR